MIALRAAVYIVTSWGSRLFQIVFDLKQSMGCKTHIIRWVPSLLKPWWREAHCISDWHHFKYSPSCICVWKHTAMGFLFFGFCLALDLVDIELVFEFISQFELNISSKNSVGQCVDSVISMNSPIAVRNPCSLIRNDDTRLCAHHVVRFAGRRAGVGERSRGQVTSQPRPR